MPLLAEYYARRGQDTTTQEFRHSGWWTRNRAPISDQTVARGVTLMGLDA